MSSTTSIETFNQLKLELLRLTWESPSSAAFGMSHFKMVNYHFDPVSAHYAFPELIPDIFKEKDVELTAMSTPYKMNPPTPK